MIEAVTLENFRLFRHIEVGGLSPITLVGGQNNVGKTSLLEALFLFHDWLNPKMILRLHSWRQVGVVPLVPEHMWGPIFRGYDLKRPVTITVGRDGTSEEMILRFNPHPEVRSIPVQVGGEISAAPQVRTEEITATYALEVECHRGGETVHEAQLYTDATDPTPRVGLYVKHSRGLQHQVLYLGPRSQSGVQEDARRFGQLDLEGETQRVADLLSLIEPRLQSLSAVPLGDLTLIHGDIGLGRKIPVAYMGDGMARLLSVILAIATTPKGLVLIDEFENGIHHSAMARVWKGIAEAAKEFDCQVIATTHSYECLQAAHEGLQGAAEDRFAYIRLDRDGEEIVPKQYSYEILGAALEQGWEVR